MNKALNNLITLVEEINCDGRGIQEKLYSSSRLCRGISCHYCAFRLHIPQRKAKKVFMENIHEYKNTSTDPIS